MDKDAEKIEDIEAVRMYQMIAALLKYDYFSTKCLVNEFLSRRKDKMEIENLEKLQELLFYQKVKEVEQTINDIVKNMY